MGSQISVQASENVQEQISETVNNIMNSVNNEISSKTESKQRIEVDIGDNATIGGKFHINQSANVQMSAIIDTTSSLVAEVSSETSTIWNNTWAKSDEYAS
jgi:NDP-sugar pyrophosphorylase family protein